MWYIWRWLRNNFYLNFSGTQKDFVNERMDLKDDSIKEKTLKNPDAFVKSFEDGKYPVLSASWTSIQPENVWYINGYFYYSDNVKITNTSYDFIVQNWEIKFWFWHSALSSGKNVDFAWTVSFDSDGLPWKWSKNIFYTINN